MHMRITVVIGAYNGEKIIKNAIKSAFLLTDDVLVIDTESTDNTYEVAKKLGCRVLHFPYHRYVEPSREFAIASAKGDWIFILDADEVITKELAEEIHKTIEKTNNTHFFVPRKNIFAGKKWLRYGGWYPDGVLRLIKKESFKRWPTAIHSTPQIIGSSGTLSEPFVHYFHPDLENMVSKTIVYEDIESDLLYKAGKTVTMKTLFRKFFGELYRRMFKKFGFLDGTYGIIESLYQAYSKTITYLMLYEKYQK